MRTRFLLACVAGLLILVLAPAILWSAEPESGSDPILQQELKQQQIQRSTQRVGQTLAAIIVEFENNGISGEDVRTLKAIRAVLDRLSEKEMARVLSLLQEARSSRDPAGGRQQLAGAYSGQRTIITLLKQLLLEFERQQALYELSIRFREMAARQGRNMRTGVWLARNNPQGNFNEEQKLSIQMQHTDQLHIKEDSAILVAKLNKLAADSDGTATGERPKAAARQIQDGGLMKAIDAAAEDLKTRKLLSATSNEKRARDELRDLARLLLMSKDAIALLRAAIAETEAAIMLQKQVLEETAKVDKREEGLIAEDRQFEVVDATDLIRRDVQDVAPAATSYLRTAIDRMQETRELLLGWESGEKKRREGTAKQRTALTNLELARGILQEQLARAEAESVKPEGILDHLKDLQKEVRELARQEEKLKDDAARVEKKPQDLRAEAPMQGEIKDKAQDAQQQAASQAPAAARALSEAAAEMEKSQKALAKGQNAPENQRAAVDALRRADQELTKDIGRLEEAEKQLTALDNLADKVGDLIKNQEKINIETAKEAAKSSPSASTAKDLSQQEKGLSKEAGQAQRDASEMAPAAAPHLAEAQSQMSQSSDQLGKPDASSAQAPERKALSELMNAKQAIETRMSELRQDLGQNDPASDASLASAAAALEKAQSEVSQAMAQMANAPAGLLDSLTKQERQIAAALGDNSRDAASSQVEEARKAAAKAAEQLGQGDLQNAIGSMEQAQRSMQAAQSAEPPPAQPAQPLNEPSAGAQTATIPQLAQRQSDLKKQAEALLAAQQAAPATALDAAVTELERAANDVTPVAAGEMGMLPPAAQSAVHAALNALNNATAQAAARQRSPAQRHAATAAQELAKAQAALALAEAGLSAELARAEQGSEPGQSQPAPAAGQAQQSGQGKAQGKQPGTAAPSPRGTGQKGNWSGQGGAAGPQRQTAGPGQFVGLPKRDRAALQQSQAETYPQEYGPLIEQYRKNLSDQAGP